MRGVQLVHRLLDLRFEVLAIGVHRCCQRPRPPTPPSLLRSPAPLAAALWWTYAEARPKPRRTPGAPHAAACRQHCPLDLDSPRRDRRDNVVSRRLRTGLEADRHSDQFAHHIVRHRHRRGLGHPVVEVDGILDLLGRDILATADNDVLDYPSASRPPKRGRPTAVGDVHEPLGVNVPRVSRVEPSILVDRLRRGCRVVEVARRDVEAADLEHADLTRRQGLARLHVHDAHFVRRDGWAAALGLGVSHSARIRQ